MRISVLSLLFFCSVLCAPLVGGAQNACLEMFSERSPVLLGEGQGGVVHRVFVSGTGFVARKIYFEKEELLNDQKALEILRAMDVPGVRIVRWLKREELVVDMQYVDGAALTPLSSQMQLRRYQQYLSAVRDIFHDQVSGIKHMDFYQSREDGLWRLSVMVHDKDSGTVRILLRPHNFIIEQGALVLIDPH